MCKQHDNHNCKEINNLISDLDGYNLQYDDNDIFLHRMVSHTRDIQKLRTYPEYSHLSSMVPFEIGDVVGVQSGLPDFVYVDNEFVIGIEHFEFDSSKTTKKGSKMRKERKTADKTMKNIRNTISSPAKVEVAITAQISYENYVDSLLCVFKNHASKIEKYREALSKKYTNKTILLAFNIVDSTPLGNYYVEKNKKPFPLLPTLCIDFIKELLNYNGIDYLFMKYKEDLYVPCIMLEKVETIKKTNLQELYQFIKDKHFVIYEHAMTSNINI